MHWRSIFCYLCSKRTQNYEVDNIVYPEMSEVLPPDRPVVTIEQGTLQGIVCSGITSYIAFKGIPYAKPPLGNLRFKAPEPAESWQGIRDASQHGPICPQYNERMQRLEPGSEDCLYLNVFTKSLAPTRPLPVMVWIHGGAYYTGSGNSDFYGPEFLIAQDAILVTFNYRLEVLGFLCLDTEDIPGNAGMKDQVLALKWVKKNIKAFGGDPENITIFGCSAGSASVSYHLVSKMSEGLFHKAICQSGTCLNEWGYNIYAQKRAFQLGQLLGKDTQDPKELAEFLRSVPVSSLVNVQLPHLDVRYNDLTDSILFAPVVESSDLKVDTFLSDLPQNLVRSGQMAKVPIIIGNTSGEGIEISRKLPYTAGFLASEGALVPRELKVNWSPEQIREADEKIRKQYFNGKVISEQCIQEYTILETDKLFLYNTIRYARYHAYHTSMPVYLYQFIAETERNYTKRAYKMDSIKGTCHADDLHYLFNVTSLDIPLTDESKVIIKRLVELWVSFANSGKPTSSDNIEWKPFSDPERSYVIIGDKLEPAQKPSADNMAFWEDLYGESQLLV